MKLYVNKGFHRYAIFATRVNSTHAKALFGIVRRNNVYQVKYMDYKVVQLNGLEEFEIGSGDVFNEIRGSLSDLHKAEQEAFTLMNDLVINNSGKFVKINKRDLRVNDMSLKYTCDAYTSDLKHGFEIVDNVTEFNIYIHKSDGGIKIMELVNINHNIGSIISVPDEVAEKLRGLINRGYINKRENLYKVVSGMVELMYGENLFINR